MSENYRFLVTDEDEKERIDKYIADQIDSLSRSFIQKMLKEGQIEVNGSRIKANYRLRAEDEICISLPEAVEPDIRPEEIPLDILYEDEDVLVVNKPKGMVVHPAAGHYSGTLVNALMAYCKDSLSGINGVMRPGIVHRIDRDTTGSLIVCKNDAAHQSIAAQLKEHSIVRRYRAIVCGIIKEDSGTVHLPVGRDPVNRKKMAVNVPGGKDAITHFQVLERFPIQQYTYIECRLETGRTHQIRVHMEAAGHPLLGDEVYKSHMRAQGTGNKRILAGLQGQTLHAMVLGFHHPRSGAYIETVAPLPEYFAHLLETLH